MTQFVRRTDTVWREIDGDVLLVPCRREVHDLDDLIFLLEDAVSRRVWSLLERPCTPDDLARAVAAEFEVEPSVALTDVSEFLSHLVRIGAATTDA